VTLKSSNFIEILQGMAISDPSRTAFSYILNSDFDRFDLTYQELDLRSRSIAASLQIAGLEGERVLLLYPPSLEFITALFGCLCAGVVAVPVYPPRFNRSFNRLQSIITDAQASAVLTTGSVLANLQDWVIQDVGLSTVQWLTTDNVDFSLAEYLREVAAVRADDLALLQYTSGSTGTPKGVMLSNENLIQNSSLIQKCFDATSCTRLVSWLPQYHDMGLIGGILQPLYSGFLGIVLSPVTFLTQPLIWLKTISHYRATVSGGPSFAYDLVCRNITPEQKKQLDLSSWDTAFVGAEPVRAEVLERFADTFADCGFRREAFYPCYGLAESTLFVTGGLKNSLPTVKRFKSAALTQNQALLATESDRDHRELVSCGRAWLDTKVKIVDPESCIPCRNDEVGEIWLAGASVAQGYWQKIEASRRDFQAYLADRGESQFLRTGDLGFLHDGELFITGRIKDLIIMRGRNYYSQDIERTVEQCHPCLRAHCIAAFAFEAGDTEHLAIAAEVERSYLRELTGQKVSSSNSKPLQVSTVVNAIRRAVLREHEITISAVLLLKTGSIPKTSSGKIQHYACRDGFLSNNLNIISCWQLSSEDEINNLQHNSDIPLTPMEKLLHQLWCEELLLESEKLSIHDKFLNLGGDSMTILTIIEKLERRYSIQLESLIFHENQTIFELASWIDKHSAKIYSKTKSTENRRTIFKG
jgi:acyl-CoA synthetase (AMP-forming)/AMP-acid ligase II/acyl carrier protein